MLDKGHDRHASFFRELAFEKVIKALVTQRTNEMPPKIHNLLRLCEIAGVELTPEKRTLYKQIQEFCMEGRYPGALAVKLERAEVEKLFRDCEEETTWLLQILDERSKTSSES